MDFADPETAPTVLIFTKLERPIECGSVRVSFIARKNVRAIPVQKFNTPRGTISVSTVEATAVDLAGYPHHAGGLDQVATILTELGEKIDPKRLTAAANTAPARVPRERLAPSGKCGSGV